MGTRGESFSRFEAADYLTNVDEVVAYLEGIVEEADDNPAPIEGELQIGGVTVMAVGASAAARAFPLRAVVLQVESLEGFTAGRWH